MTTILFLGLFFTLLVIGCPIAYAMLIVSAGYMALVGLPILQLTLKTAGGVDSFTLLAIPMFLLAGNLMNNMGVTDRLFRFTSALVGHIAGGLGQVNIMASIIFAGMSGSAVADAGGLGAVEIRAMREAGYSKRFSAAITAASGNGRSGDTALNHHGCLCVSGRRKRWSPLSWRSCTGFDDGLLLMICVFMMAKRGVEPMPKMERALVGEVADSFIKHFQHSSPRRFLFFGIIMGIFTPTEASVVVVLYVLLIGAVYLGFDIKQIFYSVKQSVRSATAALFIIAVSHVFSWIITIQQVPAYLTEFLGAHIQGQTAIMLLMVLVLLLVGMFMEVLAALILLVPTFPFWPEHSTSTPSILALWWL